MTGTLTISGGISRFEGTRLMKGAINNGGFGRATNFLELDRLLKNNDEIWVDGTNDTFNEMPIILITDAGKAAGVLAMAGRARKSARKTRAGKAAKKKSAKSAKSARKVSKSTKSTKKGARKATGSKKSAKKRARAK